MRGCQGLGEKILEQEAAHVGHNRGAIPKWVQLQHEEVAFDLIKILNTKGNREENTKGNREEKCQLLMNLVATAIVPKREKCA